MLQLATIMAQPPRPDLPQSPDHEKRRGAEAPAQGALYCPSCARQVDEPLTCGDCSAVICRVCGTPLEAADDLAMG
jgi:hypothetical protein